MHEHQDFTVVYVTCLNLAYTLVLDIPDLIEQDVKSATDASCTPAG